MTASNTSPAAPRKPLRASLLSAAAIAGLLAGLVTAGFHAVATEPIIRLKDGNVGPLREGPGSGAAGYAAADDGDSHALYKRSIFASAEVLWSERPLSAERLSGAFTVQSPGVMSASN